MKKLNLLLVLLLIFTTTFLVASCDLDVKDKYSDEFSVVMPTGAPTICLSKFIKDNEKNTIEIVSGADPLVAAFTNASYDVIVAPVNLGAKFYNQTEDFAYILYRPIVGCNYYILSTEELSFTDLDGRDMESFNEAATPGVMLKTLCAYYEISPNVHYNSSVGEVNPLLLSGKADIILTAEPSKTVVTSKKSFYEIDILALWQEMAGSSYNVPQAGIFVKKECLSNPNFVEMLEAMDESVKTDARVLAESAIEVDPNLSSMNVDLLTKAIPNCHFITNPLNQAEIEYYFQKVIDFGLGKTIGNKLPDEGFYY